MPIYEYVCRNCGHQLEQLQKLSDDALTDCPACGESTLKRKVSAAGFRLAGGGWYETDFKSDGRRNVAGSNEKSGAAKNGNGSDNAKSGTDSGTGGANQPAASAEKKKTAEKSGGSGKAASSS